MYAEQLMENMATTHAINGLVSAKMACSQLRERGGVVLSVTIGEGRPLILIQRPPRDLKKHGELVRIISDDNGRHVFREHTIFGCCVRWED